MANDTNNIDFNTEIPITGGNTLTIKNIIDAVNKNIGISIKAGYVSNAISKANDSAYNSYNSFWLLQFQADYFANLIDFKFNNVHVNRQIGIAIRLGIIYGSSVLWKVGNSVVAMYVNKMELNEMGEPSLVKMYRGDYVLMNQSLNELDLKWVERDLSAIENKENFIIFIPNDYNLGGLIKWMPFIRQLERLLKMLYTHSYSHAKSILYNVKDKKAIKDELELFFSCDNPFIINTGDESILSNKFKEFQAIKNTTNDTDTLVKYIQDFLNIYYDLIGRRYNSDRKRERNLVDEIDASQENYDILQRPIKRNITQFLEEIENKFGWKNQKTAKDEGVKDLPSEDGKESQNAL